jgi:hypothetical protein
VHDGQLLGMVSMRDVVHTMVREHRDEVAQLQDYIDSTSQQGGWSSNCVQARVWFGVDWFVCVLGGGHTTSQVGRLLNVLLETFIICIFR